MYLLDLTQFAIFKKAKGPFVFEEQKTLELRLTTSQFLIYGLLSSAEANTPES